MYGAGWHPDPMVPGLLRYWDGERWTEHTAPMGPPATMPRGMDTGPSSSLHYLLPVGRSWQSIWAPYLGLFSIVPIPIVSTLLGAGGITLGIIALTKAKSGGHGTGRAIVGIVLGAIGMVISVMFTLWINGSN